MSALSKVDIRKPTNPTSILGKEGVIYTILKSAVADVTLFEVQMGVFNFEDSNGHFLTGTQLLQIKSW